MPQTLRARHATSPRKSVRSGGMRRRRLFLRGGVPFRTNPIRVVDLEAVRGFLDQDPVGNAVVWDRVFQTDDYEVHVDRLPPAGLIAIRKATGPDHPNFIVLHASDPNTAGRLCELVPPGFTIFHVTEEFPLALLAARATEFHPRPAWLFRLEPHDLVDRPDDRVRPLEPQWAERVAKLWEPDWPAEGYVRRRLETAPSAAVYEEGTPVAWGLTHMVTDKVGIIGMVHVVEDHRRRGLARAVVAAISRDLLRLGKIPALHAYTTNTASLALFPTLGFRKVKRQSWGEGVFA